MPGREYPLHATEQRARQLRDVLQSPHAPAMPVPAPGAIGLAESVKVRMLETVAGDDLTQHDAVVLKLEGGAWVSTNFVLAVRNIGGTELTAGEDYTARPTSNLGHCIDVPPSEQVTVNNASDTCCGKCLDPDDWTGVTISGTEYPAALTVNLPSLTCCGAAREQVRLFLFTDDTCSGETGTDKYEWLDGSCNIQTVSCTDGATVQWTLDPVAATFTATHSVDGVVARYTPETYESLWCPVRWTLDETVTKQHSQACSICPREICITPAPNYVIDSDCHTGSDHKGILPCRWQLDVAEHGETFYGTYHPAVSLTLYWEQGKRSMKAACTWNNSARVSGNFGCLPPNVSCAYYNYRCTWYSFGYCSVRDEWVLQQFNCNSPLGDVAGSKTFPNCVGTSYEAASWADASFDPQGQNSSGNFTLTPVDCVEGSPGGVSGPSFSLGAASAPPPPPPP